MLFPLLLVDDQFAHERVVLNDELLGGLCVLAVVGVREAKKSSFYLGFHVDFG